VISLLGLALCRAKSLHTLTNLQVAVYDSDRSGTLDKKEWEKVTRWHITRKKDAMIVEGSFARCDTNEVRSSSNSMP
jgi:hypothetical protein